MRIKEIAFKAALRLDGNFRDRGSLLNHGTYVADAMNQFINRLYVYHESLQIIIGNQLHTRSEQFWRAVFTLTYRSPEIYFQHWGPTSFTTCLESRSVTESIHARDTQGEVHASYLHTAFLPEGYRLPCCFPVLTGCATLFAVLQRVRGHCD
jgi:hypothetical protein